eukprot:TRINITY_DN14220_c0_g1_i5.p1 TRINITY_DN14220_c0_g1~~TRINITY_DN14220_c0_g1_i5.p1  ORF type:complete len:163 (+),score=21.39 TRINITY_DN14220_c0_g1_i5:3-491(+)
MVQKLVVSAQADVNEAGTIQNERLFRESKLVGHTVTPLYLAAALGECDIAAFLIPRQGRVMSGRTYEGGVESPLHACLARAVPNVSKQSGSYAYTPKRQVIKCAAVQKIASMLIRANCDVNEVCRSVRCITSGVVCSCWQGCHTCFEHCFSEGVLPYRSRPA